MRRLLLWLNRRCRREDGHVSLAIVRPVRADTGRFGDLGEFERVEVVLDVMDWRALLGDLDTEERIWRLGLWGRVDLRLGRGSAVDVGGSSGRERLRSRPER